MWVTHWTVPRCVTHWTVPRCACCGWERTSLGTGHEIAAAHHDGDGVLLYGCWLRVARQCDVVADDLSQISVAELEQKQSSMNTKQTGDDDRYTRSRMDRVNFRRGQIRADRLKDWVGLLVFIKLHITHSYCYVYVQYAFNMCHTRIWKWIEVLLWSR